MSYLSINLNKKLWKYSYEKTINGSFFILILAKNESLFRKEILGIFEYVSSIERNYFKKLDYTDLPQIVGRQRDRSNPFKNIITLFYN